MSRFPSVRQALDWVRELDRAAREFDERERRREEEHRADLLRENAAFRQAVEAAEERRAQRIQEEESAARAQPGSGTLRSSSIATRSPVAASKPTVRRASNSSC